MKICLAAYNTRLASLFDNATQLKLYTYDENEQIHPAGEIFFSGTCASSRISALTACGVDILICGALSGCAKEILTNLGVEVYDWVRGDIKEVIVAWQEGKIDEIAMPGCRVKKKCY